MEGERPVRSPESQGRLRVLFAVRKDLHDFPGGDTVQVCRTADALRELGVEATISDDHRLDTSAYDCVHLWNLERAHDTYAHLLNARRAGKPIVLSPIYWEADPATGAVSMWFRGLREDAKNLVRYSRARGSAERQAVTAALTRRWRHCRREILGCADAVLPNSLAEADLLIRQGVPSGRCHVVVNGVDHEQCLRAVQTAPASRQGVLCVGHFDRRKNQLALIRALRDTDVPVTFVGGPRRLHERYYRRCLRLAGGNMRFAGSLSGEDVLTLMTQARVHACPSFLETPGLANLEAAAVGCRLAVGDCPPVREYFGEQAAYFDAGDPIAIRRAVLKQLEADAPAELSRLVLSRFTWAEAAKATLSAYRAVLSRSPT